MYQYFARIVTNFTYLAAWCIICHHLVDS